MHLNLKKPGLVLRKMDEHLASFGFTTTRGRSGLLQLFSSVEKNKKHSIEIIKTKSELKWGVSEPGEGDGSFLPSSSEPDLQIFKIKEGNSSPFYNWTESDLKICFSF